VKQKSILIIDRQSSWREEATVALQSSGYVVYAHGQYEYPLPRNGKPDLVIFGCVKIRREERNFIKKLIMDNIHLLVLSSSLPWSLVRPLFLDGVEDVNEKSYQKDKILRAVEEAFNNMTPKDAFDERRRADL
jgi:DNA-binding NarL/FixJ family response regulator